MDRANQGTQNLGKPLVDAAQPTENHKADTSNHKED